MSKENPTSPETAEEKIPKKTSRRDFLVGSAAAVGALAATAVPREAQAEGQFFCGLTVIDTKGQTIKCPPPPPYYKLALAKMIVNAWLDSNYRSELLTFDEGKPIDWAWYGSTVRLERLAQTKKKFVDEKILIGNVQPVVLSQDQFENGIFRKQDDMETIFQLPDAPEYFKISSMDKETQWGIAKYAIDFHVCGM